MIEVTSMPLKFLCLLIKYCLILNDELVLHTYFCCVILVPHVKNKLPVTNSAYDSFPLRTSIRVRHEESLLMETCWAGSLPAEFTVPWLLLLGKILLTAVTILTLDMGALWCSEWEDFISDIELHLLIAKIYLICLVLNLAKHSDCGWVLNDLLHIV